MKSIYELKLHEGTWDSAEKVFIYRVAAGWIYAIGSSHVFVPFDNRFEEECAAQNIAELAATASQQLQAKIRAIVLETEEAQNGNCDAGEILSDLVANLRVLSAM